MNRLPLEKRLAIISALTNGAGINATARQTQVSHVTVLKLLAEAGAAALEFQRRTLVNLPCKRIQCDEIWSFVGCKEKRVPRDERGRGRGDAWTWTALCEDTKLVPCWHIGLRDADAAFLFMEDLASRLAHRVTLTTDGLKHYLSAVENAFGYDGIDYAMLVKIYGSSASHAAMTKFGPAPLVGVEREVVFGRPDVERISTSFIEAQNMTMRQNVRRFTRLTNGHSKKLENHVHAISLYFMSHNFCRKHLTLTKNARGIHTTPAMAAGLTDHVWTWREVLEHLP